MVVRQLVHGIHDLGAVLMAEFLPKLGCSGRADLYTLTAGNTLFCIDMRPISAPGHVRRIE